MATETMWSLILGRAGELRTTFRSAEMVEWLQTTHAERRFKPNSIRNQLRDMAVNVVPDSMARDFPARNVHNRLLWREENGVFRLYDPAIDPPIHEGQVLGSNTRGSGSQGLPSRNTYRVASERTDIERPRKVDPDPDAYGRGAGAHGRIQNALAAVLDSLGVSNYSPARSDPHCDIYWEVDSQMWVAEVKSLTEQNEEHQLRLGLGQILRYQGTFQAIVGRAVGAVLAVEREPSDQTWRDLCAAHDVLLLCGNETLGLRAGLRAAGILPR